MNKYVLPVRLEETARFEDVHSTIYCAAIAIARYNGAKIRLSDNDIKNYPEEKIMNVPKWQQRLQRKIEGLRADIGRLVEVMRKNPSKKLERKVKEIIERRRVHARHDKPNQCYADYLDTLKQKLAVYAARIRRYTKSKRRREDNLRFRNNEKGFYRDLKQSQNQEIYKKKEIVQAQDMEHYWSGIWSKSVVHNEKALWIAEERENYAHVRPMPNPEITIDEVKSVVKELQNWKSPGTDKLHNYWYKKFECTHTYLQTYINNFMRYPDQIPTFLMEGRTTMIPKNEKPTNASEFRPITCLQTFYKIMTSCISRIVLKHMDQNDILAEEQKGCRQGMMGCKEQLLIDELILEQAYKQNRNMSCSYIDYRKAYDSIPHSWLLEVLDIYNINHKIIEFLRAVMKQWKTKIATPGLQNITLPIRRGIFQGDSLSPLWFCIALNPLSHILQRAKMGYLVKGAQSSFSITHLLYMDDLKVFSSSHTKLNEAMKLVNVFSQDIHMRFGLDKCRTLNIKKKKVELHGFEIGDGTSIEPMTEQDIYKYLGIQQARRIAHKEVKKRLSETFSRRVERLLRTELNARNLIHAINTFAIPVLTYSFGIIEWSETELNKLQCLVRTFMSNSRKHHIHASVHRTMLPRAEGGRGLTDIKALYHSQVHQLKEYFLKRREQSLLYTVLCEVDEDLTPLKLSQQVRPRDEPPQLIAARINDWKSMTLHGKHPEELSQPYVDKEMSNAWLTRGDLYPETEGFMIAIQDQVIRTRNYEKHIMKDNSKGDKCRRCHLKSETIQHITSGCQTLVGSDYLYRHNQVAGILHQELALKYGLLQQKVPYYKYKPHPVLENDHAYVLFDRTVLSDRTVEHNRPDLVLHIKEKKWAFIIDVAVPNTNGLLATINEKRNKYERLKEEMERVWNLNHCEVLPIVLSATGIVPKDLMRTLDTLGITRGLAQLIQKTVVLNTTRIVRKFLNC